MDRLCSFDSVYTEEQRKLIDQEFERIRDEHFLDHAGGTLYSEKQVENITSELQRNLLCNPHSGSVPSQKTEDTIDILRYRILQHFHASSEEYTVIFTANTTASLKLVAENFNYGSKNACEGVFAYLEDNHTSVLGMRSYSEVSRCIRVEEAFQTLGSSSDSIQNLVYTNSLFVYPTQCNFSGTKYPLEWIEIVQNGRLNSIKGLNSGKWYVLIDAANFVGTNELDLSKYKPDFVTFSFYKMFGYPTGVGVLLVKNDRAEVLRKRYYGGGTVLMALARKNEVVLKSSLSERFEDGTLPYLSIFSLNEGFNTFLRLKLTMQSISKHTFNLAKYLYANMLTLHHSNGEPAAILYHDTTFEEVNHQGGIVNFNLIRNNGQIIGYSQVMHMASLHKIHLRTGCSCNPGACQRHLKLTSEDVKGHFRAGHVCGDQKDLIDGVPTGSVRVSFGYMSKKEDVDAILEMITECFVQKPVIKKLPKNWNELRENYRNKFTRNSFERVNQQVTVETEQKEENIKIEYPMSNATNGVTYRGILKQILIYPIKSCGAFKPPKSWRISNSGLEYDRKWMIVNKTGSVLSQKQKPTMCLIKPKINLELGTLELTYPGRDSISLTLHDPLQNVLKKCESKVCRDKVTGIDCGDDVSEWVSSCLDCSGLRLIKQTDHQFARVNKNGQQLKLSFANESQYLMVNLSSVKWLRDRVEEADNYYRESLESMVMRFRPNMVIDFDIPFVETSLKTINIDRAAFKTVGLCTRCQMICINQVNAEKTREPLTTLARELGGCVRFGVYLGNLDSREKDTLELEGLVVAEVEDLGAQKLVD